MAEYSRLFVNTLSVTVTGAVALNQSFSLLGFHVCAAGWYDRGRVGYPIVKAGVNCGFGKVGIIDYGFRLNKSERWDVYCYNPNCECMFCTVINGDFTSELYLKLLCSIFLY